GNRASIADTPSQHGARDDVLTDADVHQADDFLHQRQIEVAHRPDAAQSHIVDPIAVDVQIDDQSPRGDSAGLGAGRWWARNLDRASVATFRVWIDGNAGGPSRVSAIRVHEDEISEGDAVAQTARDVVLEDVDISRGTRDVKAAGRALCQRDGAAPRCRSV